MASPLVEPIVPTPDYSGVTKGLMLYAEGRRNAQLHELGQQKLVQDAANDNAMMEYRRQALANQFAVQQSQIDLNKAHEDYYRNYETPLRNLAAAQVIDYNKQTAQLKFDAAQRRQELGLDDPLTQTKNPIQFAANTRRFADEFGTAPVSTGIGALIQADKRVTDQMKIPLKLGVQYDSAGDPIAGTGTATPISYPVLQVVEKLQDPAWSKYMTDSLRASGFMKDVPGAEHKEGQWDFGPLGKYGGKTVREKGTTEVGDFIGRYLKQGSNVDFSRGASRVPAMMAPGSGSYKGTGELRQGLQQQLQGVDQSTDLPDQPDQSNLYPAATPAASGPPGPQPTETDQLLNQARAALQAGAPLQAIAQRLASAQIDPNLLFQQRADQGLVQPISAPATRFNQTAIT